MNPTVEPEAFSTRLGRGLRALLTYLDAQPDGAANKHDALAYVGQTLFPAGTERETHEDDVSRWIVNVGWNTIGLVKANWMTKDNRGGWTITADGRRALTDHPDPAEFMREVQRLYDEWKAARDAAAPRRRAWLIRGTSVRGHNLVPLWLDEGFVSLAASQLGEIPPAADAAAVRAQADADYAHLKPTQRKRKATELSDFVARMVVGDVVVTTSGGQLYLGDVTGDWQQLASAGGLSNLRRTVEWRNADAPLDFNDLPAGLPGAFQTEGDLIDLTEHLEQIDALGAPAAPDEDALAGDPTDAPDTAARASAPFAHLPAPSEALAAELFIDHVWLREAVELLDERRQIVFYGPPGTGKTFIAQALAAELVGWENVRLVQFHPAYAYEDFFEGYRPAPGASDGTIGFELRPGPLRRLATAAAEHADQAYVLVIDELNRANLAKVFGELYFLLEYRDRPVELLYSPGERFTLPKNLFLIGTMNTADRSIALIDQAMRRRFAFLELSPTEEPIRSLLRRWSHHHGLGDRAADLLDELNRRIDDPEFQIGPSYFMAAAPPPDHHSDERLARLWRTAILPLLQEHFYGQWDEQTRKRFALDALLKAIAPPSTPTDSASDGTGDDADAAAPIVAD